MLDNRDSDPTFGGVGASGIIPPSIGAVLFFSPTPFVAVAVLCAIVVGAAVFARVEAKRTRELSGKIIALDELNGRRRD